MYSADNMSPGPVPPQLQVWHAYFTIIIHNSLFRLSLQGLSQAEEMLISQVLPIMSIYTLPRGQTEYSGHVINLTQDISSFLMNFRNYQVTWIFLLSVRRELIILIMIFGFADMLF